MLYATVRQRKIYVKSPVTVIQNGVNVDTLILDMDEEWKEMTSIVCVFTNGEVAKQVLHTFGNPLTVPWECLASTGSLILSVTGFVGEEKVMTTAKSETGWNIVQNGTPNGDASASPTPQLLQQVTAAAESANSAATAANNAATAATNAKNTLEQAAANGDFDGSTPEIGENGNWYIDGKDTGNPSSGADGKTPVVGVDYFTESDKQEIVDKVTVESKESLAAIKKAEEDFKATVATATASVTATGKEQVAAINAAAKTAQDEIAALAASGRDEVTSAANTALQAIAAAQERALSDIASARTETLNAVQAAQDGATVEIVAAKSAAVAAVSAEGDAQKSAVETAGEAQTKAVNDAGTAAVADVGAAKDSALEEINAAIPDIPALALDDSQIDGKGWSSKHIVDMLCPALEEVGNPVQCYPVPGYPLDIVASWTPTQEGSGEPSPDNIRPITGRESVTITRQEDNQAIALTLPETVYGGEVDAVSGEVAETWGFITLDGTEKWTVSGKLLSNKADWYYESSKIPNAINATPQKGNEICSHYPHSDIANKNTVQGCAIVWGCIRVRWGETIPDDADAWKTYLAAQYAAGTPVQVAYKLDKPIPLTATGGATLPALEGVNTILTDADSVTVKARADPNHVITELQDALASITEIKEE